MYANRKRLRAPVFMLLAMSLCLSLGLAAAAPALAEDDRGVNQEVYLDIIGGNPKAGQPIEFKARAKTGNSLKVEFNLDSLCPHSYSLAGLSTIYAWSYAKGAVTLGQAGLCQVLVSFKLTGQGGQSRIIQREFTLYVMQ